MNSIPRNYLPKLKARETQEAQQLIKTTLMKALSQSLEFIEIRPPRISSSKVTISNNEFDIKRPINFDSSNDNIIYFVYNRYRFWFTNALKELEIKNNNGVASFINYISRDEEITNVKSLEKNTLQIEMRYNNKNGALEKALEFKDIVIEALKTVEAELINKYPKIKKTLPNKQVIKDSAKIGNISGTQSAIDELASDYGFFLMINRRKSKSQQSLNNNFELHYYGYSKDINKAYEIFHIHDRKHLEDLEPLSSESQAALEEYSFAKEQLNNEDVRSISICIDLDTLALALLSKSHILELQSGKNIDEIEKILISSGINHL